MSTTTQRHDTAVAATVPYALVAIGDHITTWQLPAPQSVDIDRHATVWVLGHHAPPWLETGIDIDAIVHEEKSDLGYTSHTATGVLHGSCVRVRVRWHTRGDVDHETCIDPDCDRVLCYCTDQCPGTTEPGCEHPAEFVCDEHRGSCTECRIVDASEASPFRWLR